MKLSTLLSSLKNYKLYSDGKATDVEVFGLCADSRIYKKGDIFICIKGERVDSHRYAEEALEKGVVAVVTERKLDVHGIQIVVEDSRLAMSLLSNAFYGEPSKKLKVIGITGTNGKTTCSYMLSSIIKSAGKKVGVIGTLGIVYDKKYIAPELTTPDPIFLYQTLADMVRLGVEYVVMEVSAHALHYRKIEGIEFCACIFTNFTQDHLDFFSTMSEYKKAKLKLFTPEKCRLAIVNLDDQLSTEITAVRGNVSPNIRTSCYGLKTPSDAFAVVTNESLKSTEFLLNISDTLIPIRLQMTGIHNVYNALAVSVCAHELGFNKTSIAEGLNALSGVKGRLEWIASYKGGEIFIDFAHTPDGLEKSLDGLKPHTKGRLICLFGCGGNRDKTKRPKMGKIATTLSDFVVLTSDNPRFEDPTDIIRDIEKGIVKGNTSYVAIPDRERAIAYAMSGLKDGDVLLVAGKGGEDYQERMGIKYAYKDEDVIIKITKKG